MREELVLFHEWVRKRREALAISQTELATLVEYSVDMIRRIERGDRRPGRELADRLARALQIDTREHARFVKVALGELGVEALAEASPSTGLLATPQIPLQHTPFVGRKDELALIAEELQQPQTRLLSLCGPGGIGKTRLAIAFAEAQYPHWNGEVYFVPLAPLQSASLLAGTIAQALRISMHGEADPRVRLLSELRERKLLLILDNYEQLLPDVELVTDILELAGEVRMLITSRERLNILGESVLSIKGLDFPNAGQASAETSLSAVELFLNGARRAQLQFRPEDADLAAIAQICRLVEGMPLAIELAAAWTRTMPCVQIAGELSQSLSLLSTSLRNVPERHRSIRSVFEQSWQMLDADEQRVLQGMAIFRGGFTRAAAGDIVGATPLHLLSLIDKSLLNYDGAGRYDLHELVRQYAEERLEHDPAEAQAVRTRYCTYYAGFLHDRERGLAQGGQGSAKRELTVEIENLRLAWKYAIQTRNLKAIRQGFQCLVDFYSLQGWFQEGESVFREAVASFDQHETLDQLNSEHLAAEGLLLAGHGWLCMTVGRLRQASELAQRSVELLRAAGAEADLPQPLYTRAMIDLYRGNYPQAEQQLRDCVSLARRFGNGRAEGWSLGWLGLTLVARGTLDEAQQVLTRSVAVFRSLDEQRFLAHALGWLGVVQCIVGNLNQGWQLFQESFDLNVRIDQPYGMVWAYANLGLAARLRGSYATALQHYRESLAVIDKVTGRSSTPWVTARTFIGLAETELLCKLYDDAHQHAITALQMAREADIYPPMLDALLILAMLQAEQQQIARALEIAELVCTHPATSFLSRERARQLITKLGRYLPSEQHALERILDDGAVERLAHMLIIGEYMHSA